MTRVRQTVSGFVLFLLVACQQGSTAITPAQVVADLQGVVTMLQSVLPAITAMPKGLTTDQSMRLSSDFTLAKNALANLSAGLPAETGANIAQQVEGYLNAILNTLVTIPNPYSAQIQAAAVILPIVELFVNQYLPTTPTKVTLVGRAQAAKATMNVADARKRLNIPELSK